MAVTVYVLQFEDGSTYIGLSKDLNRRLEEHRRRQSPSTRRYKGNPQVVYAADFATYAEARTHEIFLKSGAGRSLLNRTKT